MLVLEMGKYVWTIFTDKVNPVIVVTEHVKHEIVSK